MKSAALPFAVSASLYYAAMFGNLGVYLPFIPVWLDWRGMTPVEIGIITSAPLFVRVLATPAIAIWSDRRGDHRTAIVIGGWVGLAAAAALTHASGFWQIILCIVLFQLATQSIIPLTDTKMLAAAQAHGVAYGRIRLWGSVAFIAANVLGGMVIGVYGGPSVLTMLIVSALATAVCAHILPGNAQQQAATLNDKSRQQSTWVILSTLLSQRWFVIIVLAAGLIQASHAVYYAFSAIHWRGQGISDTWIGILWAIGVAAEIGLFAISATLLSRLGNAGMLILGGVGAVVRWTAMAFDPPFWMLLPLQALHALSFAATYLGALGIIQARVPETMAGTAQSIHSAIATGVIMGGVTLLAGAMYADIAATSYLAMASFAFVGVVLGCWLAKSKTT
ncbi:MAG: MFS transporter [Pseudomonadota bacterium]